MLKKKIMVTSITMLLIVMLSSGIVLAEDKVLNFGWHQRPENFNLFNLIQGVQTMAARWTFSGLVTYNSEFEVMPDLAESWDVSEDGKVWTFNLRENVDWQDGQKFDAEDVMFTLRYIFDVKGKSAEALKELVVGASEYADGSANEVSGIKKIDEYTVQFTTKFSTRRFLQSLSGLYIVPEHVVKDIDPANWPKSKFVTERPYPGTGPYYIEDYKPGQYILFDK
ncbi:MAG TPA: ABC transporter substrate-binding protein, partial [Halanaerobiales bacterium]|nr:ABC transporter substrate-binding protein [Halanaerobiales bacterium]